MLCRKEPKPKGASQNGGGFSYITGSNGPAAISRSTLSQRKRQFSLSSLFWAVGPIRPSLVRGLRPRNAPSPTTCLFDLVSTLVTGAHSKEFRQPASRQSHQLSVGAGLVPALLRPPPSPPPSPQNAAVGAGLVPALLRLHPSTPPPPQDAPVGAPLVGALPGNSRNTPRCPSEALHFWNVRGFEAAASSEEGAVRSDGVAQRSKKNASRRPLVTTEVITHP